MPSTTYSMATPQPFSGDFLQHPKTITPRRKLCHYCQELACFPVSWQAGCLKHLCGCDFRCLRPSYCFSLYIVASWHASVCLISTYVHVLSIQYIQSVAVYISIWLLLFKFFQPVSTAKMCPKWGFTAAARRWDLTKIFKMEWLQVGMIQSKILRYAKCHKHVAINTGTSRRYWINEAYSLPCLKSHPGHYDSRGAPQFLHLKKKCSSEIFLLLNPPEPPLFWDLRLFSLGWSCLQEGSEYKKLLPHMFSSTSLFSLR